MAKPFIKITGGKRDHKAVEIATKLNSYDTYVEPMLGGGAMFFALEQVGRLKGKTVVLGDADRDLIDLYEAIRTNPHKVHRDARVEADLIGSYSSAKDQKKSYNLLRDLWNLGERKPAYHFCLRHACYNGLWRVNQRGEMNTPPRDRLEDIHLPTIPELLECATALEGASLLDWDFRRYEEDENMFIGPGTLVFLDPPYDGEGAFRQYTADGFTETDQRDLVRLASEWSSRGATVIYTNASTPLVRDLLDEEWPRADIEIVEVKRPVACKGESRAPVPEIIAYERP